MPTWGEIKEYARSKYTLQDDDEGEGAGRGAHANRGVEREGRVRLVDDGVGGEEGTFCLCAKFAPLMFLRTNIVITPGTLWCVEALTRAGQYDSALLSRAVAMFEVYHIVL